MILCPEQRILDRAIAISMSGRSMSSHPRWAGYRSFDLGRVRPDKKRSGSKLMHSGAWALPFMREQ